MLWWYWIILGTALLVLDIALINVYYILWFGLGALTVGGIMLTVPDMPLAVQITLFGGVSGGFLLLWLFALRPRAEAKLMAMAREEIAGTRGAVIRFGNGSGTLRLQKPIGGKDVWQFTSSAEVNAGETVVISALNKDGTLQAAPPPPDNTTGE